MELSLLFGGKHEEWFAVAELAFLHGHRRICLSNPRQMLPSQSYGLILAGCHYIKMYGPVFP
jgi:hypothetical protein